MAGIYVHIPFCRTRCAYCDFFSTTRETEAANYVAALCREIEARRLELPSAHVSTIYIGGGTPSVLAPAQIQQILHHIYANYDVDSDAEVTIEMNPDDIDPPLHSLIREGNLLFNRVSLGIQTFNDDILRLIRRRHDAASAIRAVRTLQAAGIANISIDLIYGLPGQTMELWQRDLDTAFSLGIQHLSAYALSYEEGTQLTRWRDEGRVHEISDELSVAMYHRLCEQARAAGFEHYEISNFALPGFRSRHNSSYWTGAPYLGFGPGAHSFDGQSLRRANPSDLDSYLRGSFTPIIEHLTTTDLRNEAVMCGLRTSDGIDLQHYLDRFGSASLSDLINAAKPHLQAGRLVRTSTTMHLSESAIMISDDIMSDLME